MGTEGHARRGLPGWFSIRESAARLSRIGVIDVGSNSVRLVVFDGMARSPAYFYNEKVLCGLGAGLARDRAAEPRGLAAGAGGAAPLRGARRPDGALGADRGRDRGGARGRGRAGVLRPGRARDRAAAACRQRRRRRRGWPARACCSAGPTPRGWSATWAAPRWSSRTWPTARSHACATSPLGPLQLADIRDAEQAREADPQGGQGAAQGGRRRGRAAVPRRRLVAGDRAARHGAGRLSAEGAARLRAADPAAAARRSKWIREQDQAAMSAMTGTSAQRLSLVPLAAEVLAELIRRIEPGRVAISAYGLREGLLYRQMPEAMRLLDPLIEACRHMEAAAARSPGFGDGAARSGWRRSIRTGRRREDRLMLAACLLHDVQLAGASRLPGRALLRVGDARQHRRHRPRRAGVPRAGAAQPLQGRGAGRGGQPLRRAAAARAGGGGGGARPGDAARGDAVGLGDRACSSNRRSPATDGGLRLTLTRAGAGVRRRGGRAAAADPGGAARLRRARSCCGR